MSLFDTIIILTESVLTGTAIGVGIRFLRKKQKLATRLQAQDAQNRIRDLDRQLVNPQQRMAGPPEPEVLRPYEEKYSSQARAEERSGSDVQIELTITTPVSRRRYLTRIEQPIHIGSDAGNELVLDSKSVSGRQCVLMKTGTDVMLQNLDLQKEVLIVRTLAKKRLSGKPVRVRSGDKIHIGDVTIEIIFV